MKGIPIKLFIAAALLGLIFIFGKSVCGQDISKSPQLIQPWIDIEQMPVGTSQILPNAVRHKTGERDYQITFYAPGLIYEQADSLRLGKFQPKADLIGVYKQSISEDQKIYTTEHGSIKISRGTDYLSLWFEGGTRPAAKYKTIANGWEYDYGKDTLQYHVDAGRIKTTNITWEKSSFGWMISTNAIVDVNAWKIGDWTIEKPIAWDDSGWVVPLTVSLAWEDSAYWLRASFNIKKVKNLPVTVDPTLIVTSQTSQWDTHIDNTSAASRVTNYNTSTSMELQSYGAYRERIFRRVDLSLIPPYSDITSVTDSLYMYDWVAGADSILSLCRIPTFFGFHSVIYNNQPAYSDTEIVTLTGGKADGGIWQSYTSADGLFCTWLENWNNGGYSYYGWMIKVKDDNQGWRGSQYKFSTVENATAANRPRISITYTTQNSNMAISSAKSWYGTVWTTDMATYAVSRDTVAGSTSAIGDMYMASYTSGGKFGTYITSIKASFDSLPFGIYTVNAAKWILKGKTISAADSFYVVSTGGQNDTLDNPAFIEFVGRNTGGAHNFKTITIPQHIGYYPGTNEMSFPLTSYAIDSLEAKLNLLTGSRYMVTNFMSQKDSANTTPTNASYIQFNGLNPPYLWINYSYVPSIPTAPSGQFIISSKKYWAGFGTANLASWTASRDTAFATTIQQNLVYFMPKNNNQVARGGFKFSFDSLAAIVDEDSTVIVDACSLYIYVTQKVDTFKFVLASAYNDTLDAAAYSEFHGWAQSQPFTNDSLTAHISTADWVQTAWNGIPFNAAGRDTVAAKINAASNRYLTMSELGVNEIYRSEPSKNAYIEAHGNTGNNKPYLKIWYHTGEAPPVSVTVPIYRITRSHGAPKNWGRGRNPYEGERIEPQGSATREKP